MTRFRQFFFGFAASTLQAVACAAADSQTLRTVLTGSSSPTYAVQTADQPARVRNAHGGV
ncbi:hypothetical protein [Kluyvera ascorbata]|uniref:hypothetical protein n=1 Tax=Kluyvera ascorbata TaxID=51288 RepID=UPI000DFED99E|nr:hypothetical protein [Kluyvera ascorbata]EJG2385055.1 hypothetical protein [Kluyvera ascorbata]MDU1195585.1 hypothetical protein [Kluyvera ascorbata]STW98747.1 Uncharacterised protein [Kluyvera ascorbata]BCA39538.1 hypothetical protein KATP_20600 [Kluyvera ascorbata]HBL0733787.1 hypothetical protein [Kluyvera ascorbata]